MITKQGIPVDAKIIRHHAPSDSVLEHANRVGADLVLIITGQESQLSEMLLGSSARNIISESHIPVLSVNIRTFEKEK
jgi:nucleotide-binding universal stress UspA family protein